MMVIFYFDTSDEAMYAHVKNQHIFQEDEWI